MRALTRFSEPYAATGSLAAEGARNQLGRPRLEPLELLIREAIQNCWDARRPDSESVRVEIRYLPPEPGTVSFLKETILPDPPADLSLAEELAAGPNLLTIADFGTTGLGGPTRADEADEEPTDFADFVRNIGQPPDKALGGGSFGYGKGALYLTSRARTIIVHTRCRSAAGSETRLIACALGDHYEEDDRRFTGRHWWGVEASDGVIEPLVGEEADRLAERLGLPERRSDADLGTTVAIVAPRLVVTAADEQDGDADDAARALRFVAECIAWNFWPKMVTADGASPAMTFVVYDSDREVPVPDPRSHPRLGAFAEALDRLRSDEPGDDGVGRLLELRSLKPAQRLGDLALQRTVAEPLAVDDPAELPVSAQDMRATVHHVALIRNAELIVRYQAGSPPPGGVMGYAGVFRCSLDLDDVFRRSEPPTHDDWVLEALEDRRERTFIRVSLRRVGEATDALVGRPTRTEDASSTSVPLGEFCDQLAGLTPAVAGPGARAPRASRDQSGGFPSGQPSHRGDLGADAGVRTGEAVTKAGLGGAEMAGPAHTASEPSAPGGTAERGRPLIRPRGAPTPVVIDGAARIEAPFVIERVHDSCDVVAVPEILTLDGGQVEREAPAGAGRPEVVEWVAPGGEVIRKERVTIGPDAVEGIWRVRLSHVPDAMVRVDIRVAED